MRKIFLLLALFLLGCGSQPRVAFLHIESGDVLVDYGEGFVEALDGMELDVNDIIKTEDAVATIVLYEAIFIELGEFTELRLDSLTRKHPRVYQTGSSWNKFSKLTGLESYSVETPNTIATVRSTEFGVDDDGVEVGEGEVEVEADNVKHKIRAGERLHREKLKFVKRKLLEHEKQRVQKRMKKVKERVVQLKKQQMKRSIKRQVRHKQLQKAKARAKNKQKAIVKKRLKKEFERRKQRKKQKIQRQIGEQKKDILEKDAKFIDGVIGEYKRLEGAHKTISASDDNKEASVLIERFKKLTPTQKSKIKQKLALDPNLNINLEDVKDVSSFEERIRKDAKLRDHIKQYLK